MTERVDRLLLRAHIIKRCSPLLNVIETTPGKIDAPVLRRA